MGRLELNKEVLDMEKDFIKLRHDLNLIQKEMAEFN